MDWRIPLALAVLILAGGMMYQRDDTPSAWEKALGQEERFTLRVLARLTQGEVLRTHAKNPVRSRLVLSKLTTMGLAVETEAHAWTPTFLGRRVARMLRLEDDHAGNPS